MKTIMKISLILSLIFFTSGVGFVIASVALGATWWQFADAVSNDEFVIPVKNRLDAHFHSEGSRYSGAGQYYDDVEVLDVKLDKGLLEIGETDEDQVSVEILSDPSHCVQTELDGGELKIYCNSGTARKDTELRINIPEGESFDETHLDIGAASVTMENLESDVLEVRLGAGTISGIGEILAEESHWEIGVGELDLRYLECEDTDIDCGMGSISITMAGSQDDYDCDITCGAGAVTVGSDTYSMGKHNFAGDDADGEIHVKCGMGAVDLMFDE